MKNYSANAVTPADVEAKVATVRDQVSTVDAKQTLQIEKLRLALVVVGVLNLLVAVGAYFF